MTDEGGVLRGVTGIRLGEVISNLVPKQMAMVGNEPILLHIIRSYACFGQQSTAHSYVLPILHAELASLDHIASRRLFALECGNGSVGNILSADGWTVSGFDSSLEGIAQARKNLPDAD